MNEYSEARKGYMGMGEITQADFAAIDDLFENFIPAHNEIWLFGTGEYGKAFYKYLQECGVTAAGFVVSNPGCNKTETGEMVLSIEEFKSRYVAGKQGLLLTVDEKYYDEILPKLMFLGDDLRFLKSLYKRLSVQRCGEAKTISLIFNVVDHCNLECYSCLAAAPIAERHIYDFDEYKKHIAHLKKLFPDSVDQVNFTGGDVFQHPQFVDFLEYARELFPDTLISFSTNGLLLYQQDDLFWQKIKYNKVAIYWTLYPVEYQDYEKTIEIAKKHDIDLRIKGDNVGEDKTSCRIPFSVKGTQKPHDFLFCAFHKDGGNHLSIKDGILYMCGSLRKIKPLNQKFGISLPIRKSDYLDLMSVDDAKEILDFIIKKPALCEYCPIRERHSMGEWLPSKKERSEWFLEE